MSLDVEGLKASTDIVAVVSAFVQLKKRGAEYKGLCPFHADKNPSFYVVPQKRIWHCFACDAGGDVIDFVSKIEGLTFQAACERLGAKPEWKPRPITVEAIAKPERVTSKPPGGVEAPNMRTRALGDPSRIWPYRDFDGGVLGYIARYDPPEGKQIRCWSWGARGSDMPAWDCGAWNKPRPLYRLDQLAARPDAPVLLVEGEKAADAAQELLPQYVVSTWPGGAQAWKHANFEPLRGRRVDLWPDNDEPGLAAMRAVADLLSDPRGLDCHGKMIDPNRMPDGFDAADWAAEHGEIMPWLKSRAQWFREKVAPVVAIVENSAPPEAPAEPPKAQKPPKQKKPVLAVVSGNNALSPEDEAEPLPAAMSEDALADYFADKHAKKWRYVKVWNSWYEWRGDGWHKDDTAKIDRLAVEVTRHAIYWQDAAILSVENKRRVNSKRTAGNVRDLAMSDRRIAATVDQWDRNPWLLGVPGGVVDLKTGKLLEADPEHYITKRTGATPAEGDCPVWLGLLDRVTQGDSALMGYLQRLCGYVLTGETREECFAFLYGPAQTGKSTFIRVISEILGEYHCKASMETFTESRHERHAEELAVLVGSRLVTAVETEEGKRWNESRIKALTGRDRIRARFMRENSFEFEPQFKLIIAGNHAPHLRNVDEAMRRRLHIIPFTHPVPMAERDDQLAEKLRAEYPQILAWMIRGTIEWQAKKLGRPEQITQAVDDYLESEDTFGEWLNEATERDEQGKCLSGGAYKNFKAWADTAGEHVMSQKRFVQALRERGFNTKRSNGKRYIFGLSLKSTDEPPFAGYEVP